VLVIYAAAQNGGLFSWGRSRLWQYLGRISYSLYLIHVLVLLVVMRIGYKITGDAPSAALLWFGVAGVLCVGAAHLLNVAIERPSMKWATRFKRREYSREELIPLPQTTTPAQAEANPA
jgi:peptidoglycan/LPS O-acetylase OafA/YrhL